MKEENLKQLQSLSKTAYRSGILPVFLGLLIAFIGMVNRSTQDILTGIFVFVVGYAFVKIATKVSKITQDERS